MYFSVCCQLFTCPCCVVCRAVFRLKVSDCCQVCLHSFASLAELVRSLSLRLFFWPRKMTNMPMPTPDSRIDRDAIRHLREVRGEPNSPCAYYLWRWCKKGRNADILTHTMFLEVRRYHLSWNVDATGDQHLVMRPPFTEALLKHSLSYGRDNNKLSMGHRMVLDGQECVLFTPLGFTPPDRATAAETQTSFGVWAGIETNKKFWPGSSAEIGLFGHGTSVGNGLAIAHDMGQMKTSTGKCGLGSYFSPLTENYH